MSNLKHLTWKRGGLILCWVAIAALSLNIYRSGFVRGPATAKAASLGAYTVLRTETGFDKNGNLRYTNHYVEAVRSDGSTMWRGSTSKAQQRKISFTNGDYIRTNELTGRKSTYPKRFAGGAPPQKNPLTSCLNADDANAGWTFAGEETVEGHRAARLVNVSGKRTMTMWDALDVACATLRLRFEDKDGVTEQVVSALVPGEPDAALFRVPDSFQEVAPSALHGSLPDSVSKRIDKNYNDLRAQRQ